MFDLVVEGSIPNERQVEGYWAAVGTESRHRQPILTTAGVDRLAAEGLAVLAAGTCARTAASTRWRAIRPLHGPAGHLGWA